MHGVGVGQDGAGNGQRERQTLRQRDRQRNGAKNRKRWKDGESQTWSDRKRRKEVEKGREREAETGRETKREEVGAGHSIITETDRKKQSENERLQTGRDGGWEDKACNRGSFLRNPVPSAEVGHGQPSRCP